MPLMVAGKESSEERVILSDGTTTNSISHPSSERSKFISHKTERFFCTFRFYLPFHIYLQQQLSIMQYFPNDRVEVRHQEFRDFSKGHSLLANKSKNQIPIIQFVDADAIFNHLICNGFFKKKNDNFLLSLYGID